MPKDKYGREPGSAGKGAPKKPYGAPAKPGKGPKRKPPRMARKAM